MMLPTPGHDSAPTPSPHLLDRDGLIETPSSTEFSSADDANPTQSQQLVGDFGIVRAESHQLVHDVNTAVENESRTRFQLLVNAPTMLKQSSV